MKSPLEKEFLSSSDEREILYKSFIKKEERK